MADFPAKNQNGRFFCQNSNFILQFIKLIQMLNVAQMVKLHFWPYFYTKVAFTKIQNGRLSQQNSKWLIFPPKFKFHFKISHFYSNVTYLVKFTFQP
jgi:hypothetical protein